MYVVDFSLYFWHFVCSYSMSFATYTKIQIRLFSTILKLKNTVHFRRKQNNKYSTSWDNLECTYVSDHPLKISEYILL